MKLFFKKNNHKIIFLIFLIAGLWGLGRVYFSVTDGFLVSNIIPDSELAPMISGRELTVTESDELNKVLDQPFHYLGKGCQSYVFESADGQYVLKFFKYQRFRSQTWMKMLSFLPPMEKLLEKKRIKKQAKLTYFREAWKIAFEDLKEPSGLVAVHLSPTQHLKKNLNLTDKLGLKHSLPVDDLEFLVQRKADRLVPWIENSSIENSKELLSHLVTMIVSEYQNGLSDNDPALMQNTGVYQGRPFHIDVGQFAKDAHFADPKVWHQELYNKTYNFRIWLIKNHPELGEHLTQELKNVIGNDWGNMKPYFGRQHQ